MEIKSISTLTSTMDFSTSTANIMIRMEKNPPDQDNINKNQQKKNILKGKFTQSPKNHSHCRAQNSDSSSITMVDGTMSTAITTTPEENTSRKANAPKINPEIPEGKKEKTRTAKVMTMTRPPPKKITPDLKRVKVKPRTKIKNSKKIEDLTDVPKTNPAMTANPRETMATTTKVMTNHSREAEETEEEEEEDPITPTRDSETLKNNSPASSATPTEPAESKTTSNSPKNSNPHSPKTAGRPRSTAPT